MLKFVAICPNLLLCIDVDTTYLHSDDDDGNEDDVDAAASLRRRRQWPGRLLRLLRLQRALPTGSGDLNGEYLRARGHG